jgi:hypothetical protein
MVPLIRTSRSDLDRQKFRYGRQGGGECDLILAYSRPTDSGAHRQNLRHGPGEGGAGLAFGRHAALDTGPFPSLSE